MKINFGIAGKILFLYVVLTMVSCKAGNGIGLDEYGQTSNGDLSENQDTIEENNTSSIFIRIQDEILTPACATSGCHNGTTAPLGLDLIDGKAYGKLVNKPSNQVDGLQLVEASNADASYLMHKLEGTQGGGSQMPLGKPPLSADQIELIRTWIRDGALEPTSGDQDSSGIETFVKHSDINFRCQVHLLSFW